MSYLDDIKKFVGIVKVEDISNAFLIILGGINHFIKIINDALAISHEDVDLSLGSTTLPGYNNTLTIGALKSILQNYNGCVIGGNQVKIGNSLITFPSLIVSNNGIARSNQSDIEDERVYPWLRVNPVVTPIVNATQRGLNFEGAQYADSNNPQFLLPSTYGRSNGEIGSNYVYLGGFNIQAMQYDYRKTSACSAVNYLYTPIFCPKGLASSILTVWGGSKCLYFNIDKRGNT